MPLPTCTSWTVRSHSVRLLPKAFSLGVKAAPAALASGVRFQPSKCRLLYSVDMILCHVKCKVKYLKVNIYPRGT